ncbi:type II toxin-antitoxin system RelE/ParE family toxin [Acidithiobacillus thiooxidans]|uniref:type II toxin-antitoxin system RelE/ParE family toxin n=1 Tax=Acidithiobacillus thiooxidans TaxID=930 RepID=UPI003F880873
MIKSFRHKGLHAFYESGSKAGIQPDHAAKIARILARLENAQTPDDMDISRDGNCTHSMEPCKDTSRYGSAGTGDWFLPSRMGTPSWSITWTITESG